MNPSYSLAAQPLTEPITLEDAQRHLRVDSQDDLDHIGGLIAVAREYVDGATGRVSSESDWRVTSPDWASLGGKLIPIYRTPLISVDSVSYYAVGATTLTVMPSTDYRVVFGYEPGILQITGDLPELDDRPDAVTIAFSAGYGCADMAPATHRHAVKLLVSHLYEQRQPVAFSSCAEIPYTLKNLIESQKVGGWFG